MSRLHKIQRQPRHVWFFFLPRRTTPDIDRNVNMRRKRREVGEIIYQEQQVPTTRLQYLERKYLGLINGTSLKGWNTVMRFFPVLFLMCHDPESQQTSQRTFQMGNPPSIFFMAASAHPPPQFIGGGDPSMCKYYSAIIRTNTCKQLGIFGSPTNKAKDEKMKALGGGGVSGSWKMVLVPAITSPGTTDTSRDDYGMMSSGRTKRKHSHEAPKAERKLCREESIVLIEELW